MSEAGKSLQRACNSLCRYWDGLPDGAVVDDLIHAMRRLCDLTGHKGIRSRLSHQMTFTAKMTPRPREDDIGSSQT